jgi:hypothetical protein
MESTLKNDVCNEVRRGNGSLLLHDEEEEFGSFTIVPVWEEVEETDIMTARDVYENLIEEGYQVSKEI